MQCIKCSHKNPGTVAYCQRCGAKLDFTADEIAGSLIENRREEIAHNTEFYAKQALTFAAVLFLVALTCLVLSPAAPENAPTAIPSASNGSKYIELETKMEGDLKKYPVSLEVKKK